MIPNAVYAIITARGGSKGVQGKNLRLINAKSLILYTIEAAMAANTVQKVFVSTDSPEISKLSIDAGCQVIERPLEIAGDFALSSDAVAHVLMELESRNDLPEYFALLQPTSPLRTSKHLDHCINCFKGTKFNSAISVTEAKPHPYKTYSILNKELKPLFGYEYLHIPRQSLPQILRQNGAIYLMRSEVFLLHRNFSVSPIMPFIMTSEESVDIDTELDLHIAQKLLTEAKK
jgi:CMP-N-acetylneuraminic acid synthetase